MAKKQTNIVPPEPPSILSQTLPPPAVEPPSIVAAVLKPSETVLISLGGYNLAATKTADGVNLNAATLPGGFFVIPGYIGVVLASERQAFTVISAETIGDVIQVKIGPVV